ncbi:hypothetical protein [Streptomyces lydicus]|uniref:hypothetical protein n=1 Tax=Streptomyces lydicus TaxID=47763 RepID=UPI0037A7A1BA
MNAPALTTAPDDRTEELLDTADELRGADRALDQRIDSTLTLHHTTHDPDQLSGVITRLAGADGDLALLALVLEAKADSPAVLALPTSRRHAARAALQQIAAELTHLSRSGLAETAAAHLDPYQH